MLYCGAKGTMTPNNRLAVWELKFRKADFRLLIGSCETVPTDRGTKRRNAEVVAVS
jgi:hypothetical protein